MSTSLRDALLFVTLALGAAIKREFIYVSYFLNRIILPLFMSLIQERLLLKLRLLMKWTRYQKMSGVLCVELDFHYFIETSERKQLFQKMLILIFIQDTCE